MYQKASTNQPSDAWGKGTFTLTTMQIHLMLNSVCNVHNISVYCKLDFDGSCIKHINALKNLAILYHYWLKYTKTYAFKKFLLYLQ